MQNEIQYNSVEHFLYEKYYCHLNYDEKTILHSCYSCVGNTKITLAAPEKKHIRRIKNGQNQFELNQFGKSQKNIC